MSVNELEELYFVAGSFVWFAACSSFPNVYLLVPMGGP